MQSDEFGDLSGVPKNRFHPLVFINGDPNIGKNVYIGLFSEVNAKDTTVRIGDNCDIASFVSINAADSHLLCVELAAEVVRKPILLENNIFVGSHSVILGGSNIGHHSVIAAGSVLRGLTAPPYSFISGNPATAKLDQYKPGEIN
jgi:acetyltransferase-like isoleucine patch superfamily enzyme